MTEIAIALYLIFGALAMVVWYLIDIRDVLRDIVKILCSPKKERNL